MRYFRYPMYIVLAIVQAVRLLAALPFVIIAIGADYADDKQTYEKMDKLISKVTGLH